MQRRNTRQKEAITSVLQHQQGPLLPDEIHQLALAAVPSLGIATVYRSLKNLQKEGRVCCVEIPGQLPRYECTDKGHHHHFHCERCRKIFDLERCVQGLKSLVPKGFRVTSHEITLFGRCNSCA